MSFSDKLKGKRKKIEKKGARKRNGMKWSWNFCCSENQAKLKQKDNDLEKPNEQNIFYHTGV